MFVAGPASVTSEASADGAAGLGLQPDPVAAQHLAAALAEQGGAHGISVVDAIESAHSDASQAPLPCHTQVYAWGKGEHGVLGTGKQESEPVPVPLLFGTELGMVRIKAIACSWYHTVRACLWRS